MFFISVRVQIKHYFILFQKMPYVKVSVVMRTFILMGQEKEEGGRRDNKVLEKELVSIRGYYLFIPSDKALKTPTSAEASVTLSLYRYTAPRLCK